MILKSYQSSPRSSFGLFGDALRRPWGAGVSLDSAAGRPWRRRESPWGALGTSLGVLKGPSGHLWECLRVPRGHLGSACGALPALKIAEKPVVFMVFPAMGDHCATLERLWFVLWGPWVVFGGRSGSLLGCFWEVVPGASRRSLWVFLGGLLEVDLGFVKVSTLSRC